MSNFVALDQNGAEVPFTTRVDGSIFLTVPPGCTSLSVRDRDSHQIGMGVAGRCLVIDERDGTVHWEGAGAPA